MSFLNATLIFGTLAAAVPIVLHLIARREPKQVVFPAVRFLTQRIETHRSRLRVRRWLLLALRAALLAALAIALARPQIHQAAMGTWISIGVLAATGLALILMAAWAMTRRRGAALRYGLAAAGIVLMLAAGAWGATAVSGTPHISSGDAAPAAVAIVIDNSPRSGYRTADGSRIEAMREMAQWLLSRFPADSRLAVLDRSARPAVFEIDRASAVRRVERTEPRQSVRPLSERIEAAVRLVRTSELQRRAVFVLTDLTAESWTPVDGSDANTLLPPLLAQTPRVTLQVVDLGSEDRRNRRLGEIRIADATPPRDVPVPVEPVLHMPEGAREQSVTAELKLYEQTPGLPVLRDGETVLPESRLVDRTTATVRGGGETKLLLTLPPLSTGTHSGLVRLTGADPLAVDDVRYLTVQVRAASPILLVGDAQETRLLTQALLAPFHIGDARSEFAVQRIVHRELTAEMLDGYGVIGLLDPPPPSAALAAALQQWVRQGGQLFVALGPAMRASVTAAAERGEPDPDDDAEATRMGFAALIGPLRRTWRAPPPGTFLELVRPSHGVLSRLADVAGGVPWHAYRIHLYYQAGTTASDAILARYASTDHPALIDRRVGEGRVLLMTTPLPALAPPAAEWNELFSAADAWPAFVLSRHLFDFLAGRDAGTLNVTIGQPVALPLPEGAGTETRLQMFSPDAPPAPVGVAGQTVLPGIPTTAGNYWLRGEGAATGFSANLQPSATRLERVDPAVLSDILGKENFALVRDREAISQVEGHSGEGRPLYSQAMLLALAVFLLEQILGNRFYASSTRRNWGWMPRAVARS